MRAKSGKGIARGGGPPRRRRKVVGIVAHSIGLVLFTVLVARYWPGLRRIWGDINWGLFAWSCAPFPVLMALKTQRFRLLSREAVGPISYRYAYLVYFASYFIGMITPGRVGEFAKVHYLMTEKGATASQAFRAALIDRLFDMLCLAAVGSVGFAVLGLHGIEGMTPAKIAGFALLAILLLTGPLWGRPPVQALGRIRRIARVMTWLDETLAAFYTQLGAHCAILTALAYAIGFYQAWLIARAAGIDVIPYHTMCVIMAAISLAMLLPISVSGFGTREAAAILLMGQMYGVPQEQAIGFSLLYFGVFNVFGGMIGLACWSLMPLYRRTGLKESLTRLKATSSEMGERSP